MRKTTTTERPSFESIVGYVAGIFRIPEDAVTARYAYGPGRHAKRQLCYLANVNGFEQAEIARLLGVSRQSIASQISTFTKHLCEARLAEVEARFAAARKESRR